MIIIVLLLVEIGFHSSDTRSFFSMLFSTLKPRQYAMTSYTSRPRFLSTLSTPTLLSLMERRIAYYKYWLSED